MSDDPTADATSTDTETATDSTDTMSDQSTTPGDGPTTTDEQTATDGQPTTATDDDSASRGIDRYVRYAVLAGLTLLALVALLRFYFATSAAIDTWVSPAYQSVFQAAFNLVVLLIAGVGISWQVRELQ